MLGYVAVTDPGWYRHLLATPGPEDANFWRPSTRTVQLEAGTPFFFKLKAPHHAIAGFGYFAGFTILPDWLAWDTFREANGVFFARGTVLDGKVTNSVRAACTSTEVVDATNHVLNSIAELVRAITRESLMPQKEQNRE